MSMFKEFRDFIMKGNVVDLAVAVIIGGAFSAIVSDLVADIIMPLVGILTGGINISGLTLTVGGAILKYGDFLQAIVDFLIIAFCIFMIVKGMDKLAPKKASRAAGPSEVDLLVEIRDLLKKKA